jgi:tetratricopeptide (TPR) repeat protein
MQVLPSESLTLEVELDEPAAEEPSPQTLSSDVDIQEPKEIQPPGEVSAESPLESIPAKAQEVYRDRDEIAEAEEYFGRGLAYSSMGDEEKALESYEKALQLDPRLGRKYLDQAIADHFLGRHDSAVVNLEKAEVLLELAEDLQNLQLLREYREKIYWARQGRDEFKGSLTPF